MYTLRIEKDFLSKVIGKCVPKGGVTSPGKKLYVKIAKEKMIQTY